MKTILLALLLLAFGLNASAADRHWWRVEKDRTLLTLPVDTGAAEGAWELSGKAMAENFTVVHDPLLKRAVFKQVAGQTVIQSKQSFSGEIEIAALVRHLAPSRLTASLQCGWRDVPGAATYTYALDFRYTNARQSQQVFTPRIGAQLHGLTDKTRAFPKNRVIRARFAKVSPVWERAYREEVEHAIASIVPLEQTWSRLRIVLHSDRVEMYRDGLLLGELSPAAPVVGNVRLVLPAGTCLAELSVKTLSPTADRFVPVPFSAKLNAENLAKDSSVAESSLPAPDRPVLVGGIPFAFPRRMNGRDHIDIGESLFHARMQPRAGNMRTLWPNPYSLDGGRITFAVPNRAYSTVWLVAAASEDANRIPQLTVRFYRPGAGFPLDAEQEVPAFSTRRTRRRDAVRLPCRLDDGEAASLWLIPVELDTVKLHAQFREADVLSMEVTKKTHDYRTFPDPADFSSFQGGQASAVQLYAMTLEEAPVSLLSSGTRNGNLYVLPERPVWGVSLRNHRDKPITGELRLTLTDPYGREEKVVTRRVVLSAQKTLSEQVPLAPEKNGLYQVRTEFKVLSGVERRHRKTLSYEGTLVQFPEDTRRATKGNSRWGLWTWYGGHGTNTNMEENLYSLRALGARLYGPGYYSSWRDIIGSAEKRRKWGIAPLTPHIGARGGASFANKDPLVAGDEEKHIEHIKKLLRKQIKTVPDLASAAYFAESSISMEATYGTYPRYNGEEKDRAWTEAETKRIRSCMISAGATFRAIREEAPKMKIGLGYCHPQFAIPLLREGFPKESFDFFGIDTPTFQRTPEMPPIDIAPSKLYFLIEEMKRLGYEKKEVIHLESYYPSNNPLAMGKKGAADHIVRLATLSLAMGSDKLAGCFALHNCSDYWGAQHYGGGGVIGRRPEYNPLPGAAAYGTMTRLLDKVTFNGFVKTGSLSTFCLRFRNVNGTLPWRTVYGLWTLHGTRDLSLTFAEGKQRRVPTRIDHHGNETPLAIADGKGSISLTRTPVWITSDVLIQSAVAAPAVYDAAPTGETLVLDPLDVPWQSQPGDYPSYSQVFPTLFVLEPAEMESSAVDAEEVNAKVWQVTLGKQAKEKPLTGWFNVFLPPKPIAIPGKAKALGLRVNGKVNWGRIVYEVKDAKGETFLSCGSKAQWNCNDEHQWSYFSHDGWRYMEFPLPSNLPGDSYRSKDNCWWGSDGDGVVDLPLTLTRMIVQHRTHNVYVNEMVKMPDPTVQLSRLVAVYEDAASMTDAPVELQKTALLKIGSTGRALPTPFKDLSESGVGNASAIERFTKPEKYYDGTQIVVHISPVPDAKEYRVYVSAYADGRGAQVMAKGKTAMLQVSRLKPSYPLYFFATTVGKDKKESKPSPIRRLLLANDFPNQ